MELDLTTGHIVNENTTSRTNNSTEKLPHPIMGNNDDPDDILFKKYWEEAEKSQKIENRIESLLRGKK
jgi:hypothetical protein